MKVFVKKAELRNIQFKKSQIQWHPITIVKIEKYQDTAQANYIPQNTTSYSKFTTYFRYITQAVEL